MMKLVNIPETDLNVSQVCVGCWQFNDSFSNDVTWQPQPYEVSKSIFDTAIKLGINFFDTAEAYVNSELVLGRCMEGTRKNYIVASKLGYKAGPLTEPYTAIDIDKAITGSLESLKTDYIDLYQVHWPAILKNMDESVAELNRQVALGRIRHYGVCNFGLKSLSSMKASGGKPVTQQVPYNLLVRGIENEILPACIENNMSILAYSPLQQGLLTGKFTLLEQVPEGRRRTRHFNTNSTKLCRHGEEGCEKQTFQAINDIIALCKENGLSMSQTSLSWILHQPKVTNVIVGSSNPKQMEDNCRLVPLQQHLVDKLNDLTEDVKSALGNNIDLWAPVSRVY